MNDQAVKLGDFGLSFRMKAEGNKLKGFTHGYLPEELEKGNKWCDKQFTKKELIDIDTFAMIKTFEQIISSKELDS